jgi:hypothetical protein
MQFETFLSFFAELGLELEGRAMVEGEWAGRVTGLGTQRVEIAVRLLGMVRRHLLEDGRTCLLSSLRGSAFHQLIQSFLVGIHARRQPQGSASKIARA